VERGWIARVRSDEDRRVQRIHLTPAGTTVAAESYELSTGCEREMLKHLTAAERGMLLELLDKVARHRRV
jgi:DNA-binding MarR family transcriptional regulator